MAEIVSRPTRAEEVKAERRRKRGSTVHMGTKLGVNERVLDRQNYAYRWINDKGGRIASMTENDDWELVDDPDKTVKGDATGLGAKVSVVVGTGDNGQPLRAYLAAKPMEFYKEDKEASRNAIEAKMGEIRKGLETPETKDLGSHAYGEVRISSSRGR